MGKVILIGGSPMTGKSTVAVAIASKLKYPCISTDDIGEALQTIAPLNPMQDKDYRNYYENTPLSQLSDDTLQYHKAVEPAIQRLIDIHSTWGNSIIIEGWALYPKCIQPLNSDKTSSVWLIANDELLEARLMSMSDFLDGTAAQNYLLRSKWHNNLLFEQCKSFNAIYILINGSESVDSLVSKILAHF